MSIHRKAEQLFEVRWREAGRNKSVRVHGSFELARKIERKKMSVRDENRHLDIKREVNFRMSALIDRYWAQYGMKKRSGRRERSVLEGIRAELGRLFVREVDGNAIAAWYEKLIVVQKLSPGTAVRHFNVMHHMMGKAAKIWSRETGIGVNPADQVEVRRPDDQRDRFLSEEELVRLKRAADEKIYPEEHAGLGRSCHQQDVLSPADGGSHRAHDGNEVIGNLRPEVERRDVLRRLAGGAVKAEGRQDALRPDVSGTG